jgi:hypothetical protein
MLWGGFSPFIGYILGRFCFVTDWGVVLRAGLLSGYVILIRSDNAGGAFGGLAVDYAVGRDRGL